MKQQVKNEQETDIVGNPRKPRRYLKIACLLVLLTLGIRGGLATSGMCLPEGKYLSDNEILTRFIAREQTRQRHVEFISGTESCQITSRFSFNGWGHVFDALGGELYRPVVCFTQTSDAVSDRSPYQTRFGAVNSCGYKGKLEFSSDISEEAFRKMIKMEESYGNIFAGALDKSND